MWGVLYLYTNLGANASYFSFFSAFTAESVGVYVSKHLQTESFVQTFYKMARIQSDGMEFALIKNHSNCNREFVFSAVFLLEEEYLGLHQL